MRGLRRGRGSVQRHKPGRRAGIVRPCRSSTVRRPHGRKAHPRAVMSEQRAVSEPPTTPDGGAGLTFGPRTRHMLMLEFGSRADFDDPRLEWRRLFSELLGTFMLVLAAAGGGILHAKGQISLAAAVVAPGLMVTAIVLFMGAVSGAHLNPGVSLAFALRRDFPWKRVPGYIIVQLIGATLACLFCWRCSGTSTTSARRSRAPVITTGRWSAIQPFRSPYPGGSIGAALPRSSRSRSPSLIFAGLGSRTSPATQASLTRRQDSSSYGPVGCSPPKGTLSWRFDGPVSRSAGHQLWGCLAITPTGLSPASRPQLSRTHRRSARARSLRPPSPRPKGQTVTRRSERPPGTTPISPRAWIVASGLSPAQPPDRRFGSESEEVAAGAWPHREPGIDRDGIPVVADDRACAWARLGRCARSF